MIRTPRTGVALAALLLTGCSMLRRGPSQAADAPLGPVTQAAAQDSTALVDSTAVDSMAVAVDSTTTVAESAPTPKPPPAKKDVPPTPEPTPPPEAKISAQQEVGVELDASTKADLAAQTRKDLEEAERLVRTLASGALTTDRREKVATVDSLITSARAAFDTDVEAAAALARKARLLAEEIGSS